MKTVIDVDWEHHVMQAILLGYHRARDIRTNVRRQLTGKVDGVPGEPEESLVYRPVDRALQALRKRGVIRFFGTGQGGGWKVPLP